MLESSTELQEIIYIYITVNAQKLNTLLRRVLISLNTTRHSLSKSPLPDCWVESHNESDYRCLGIPKTVLTPWQVIDRLWWLNSTSSSNSRRRITDQPPPSTTSHSRRLSSPTGSSPTGTYERAIAAARHRRPGSSLIGIYERAIAAAHHRQQVDIVHEEDTNQPTTK